MINIKYNGFTITVESECEFISIHESLGFEFTGTHAHAETIEKVENGELEHIIITVVASLAGIRCGEASMGSIVCESEHGAIENWIYGYLPQLADEAIEQALYLRSKLNGVKL